MFKNFNLIEITEKLWKYDRKLTNRERAELSYYFNTLGFDQITDHMSSHNVDPRGDIIREVFPRESHDELARRYIAFVTSQLIKQLLEEKEE